MKEDAHHVEEGCEHHHVGRPPVHVPQKEAVVHHERELLHVAVGLRHGGVVIEHQEHPGRDEDEGARERDPSEPVRVGETERPLPYLDGMDVQEEVLEDEQGSVAVGGRGAVAHDRPIDAGIPDASKNRVERESGHARKTFP